MAFNRIKPTKEKLDALVNRQRWLERQVKRANILGQGAKSEFWKEVKSMAKEKLAGIETKLDEYNKFSQDERTQLLEARRQQKFFLSMGEDFASDVDKLEAELAKQVKEIEDYNERLTRHR